MAKQIIITIRLSLDNDMPMIQKICSASSISSYIKSLISNDIGIESHYDFTFSSEPQTIPKRGDLHLSLNPKTETIIIDKLNTVKNKSDYVRQLVIDDMNSTKTKSFDQLADEINLSEYTSMASFSAAQFSELSALLRSNGYIAKAFECDKLAEMLIAWVSNFQ